MIDANGLAHSGSKLDGFAGAPLRAPENPVLSWRSHCRGYHSLDDLKVGVLRQGPTWWQGKDFHCGLCDIDFDDAAQAADHVVREQHPVLRMD